MTLEQLSKVYRRVLNVVGRSTQTATSVQSGSCGNAQSARMAGATSSHDVMQHYGFASATPLGTDHAIICLAGDNSNMISIATNHPEYRPVGMMDGEAKMHDNSGQSIYLKAGASIIINAKTEIDLQISGVTVMKITSSGVEITGNLMVSQDVTANGISLHDHIHGGVQSGDDVTGMPQA